MNDILTVIISSIISVLTSFLVAKYYGERWVETRRSRKEHSVKIKDDFFKPWLDKLSEYCKLDAYFSKEKGTMVAFVPLEPNDLQYYDEGKAHLNSYNILTKDWKILKKVTFNLNKKFAVFFEEIRFKIKKEIDLTYYCWGYSGDEPESYLCPDTFIRAMYDEVEYRLEKSKKKYYGTPFIQSTAIGKKLFYNLKWLRSDIARSLNEELMKKAQKLFNQFIQNQKFKERVRALMIQKRDTYDKNLNKLQDDIKDIIKSVDSGNVLQGTCKHCP